MYRGSDFIEMFSHDMKNQEFAYEYIVQMINDDKEPMSLEDALRKVIRQIGTKEFAEMTGTSPQNITEFLSGRRTPKVQTLDSFLAPFGLKTTLGITYKGQNIKPLKHCT